MTLLAYAHFETYALLAADSLNVWHVPGQPDRIENDARKVVRTMDGLAAGSGTIEVYRPVQEILERASASIGDISELMRNSLETMIRRVPITDLTRSKRLYLRNRFKTRLLITIVENSHLQVVSFDSDDEFEPQYAPLGAGFIYPIDVQDRQHPAVACGQRLRSSLRPRMKASDLNDHLTYHLDQLRRFMKAVRAHSKFVGPAMLVGYHGADAEVEIGDFISLED